MKELHERERHLFTNELSREQIGRQGLGFIKGQTRIDQTTNREHRSSVSSLTKDISEELLLASLYDMAKQGRFLGWETSLQMDINWNRLFYSWSPAQCDPRYPAFICQLKHMEQTPTWYQCSLCGYNCCTMLHIFIAASTP